MLRPHLLLSMDYSPPRTDTRGPKTSEQILQAFKNVVAMFSQPSRVISHGTMNKKHYDSKGPNAGCQGDF